MSVFDKYDSTLTNAFSQDSFQPIREEAKARDFQIAVLEGDAIHDEQSFFEATAKAFDFPEYFGRNWDAFYDCFGDIPYLSPRPLAILWNHASETMRCDQRLFKKAVQAMQRMSTDAELPNTRHMYVILFGAGPGFLPNTVGNFGD